MHLLTYLNPEILLKTFGLVGLFVIIFAESGLFFGFFLPGDSLLFTAGFLAPTFGINIYVLAIGVTCMAILGDSVGYAFGKRIGPALFSKNNSLFFKKKYLERARVLFEKHGPRTLILGRFIPAVRTFVPILAGATEMNYSIFLRFNIIGGVLWATLITLLGYYLGNAIPNIDQYLLPIVIIIAVVSALPLLFEFLREMRRR